MGYRARHLPAKPDDDFNLHGPARLVLDPRTVRGVAHKAATRGIACFAAGRSPARTLVYVLVRGCGLVHLQVDVVLFAILTIDRQTCARFDDSRLALFCQPHSRCGVRYLLRGCI